MALSAGSISINEETGEHTGSGASYDMLDAWWTNYGSSLYSGQSTAIVVAVKQGIGALLQAIADGGFGHFLANHEAEATISTSTGGLQQVDSADTDPPATQKTLPVTIT